MPFDWYDIGCYFYRQFGNMNLNNKPIGKGIQLFGRGAADMGISEVL